jgi:tetratricopeptide (TPR) repeat protein
MREGIKTHNAANGLTGAYHETLTQVWARIIYAVMLAHGPSDSAKHFFDHHSYLLNKMLPLMFYTHSRVLSKQAREEFLEPDLLPLPVEPDAAVLEAQYEPDFGYPPIPPDPIMVIEQLTQTIENNPDYADAYFHRGQNYFRLKQYETALADYGKAIELEPRHTSAYYGIGAICAIQNNVDAALEGLQIALELGFPYVNLLARDPSWDNIRDNSTFQKLIEDYQ